MGSRLVSEARKLVPFAPNQPPRRVLESFPGSERSVEELWRHDSEFREICRDYREAVASLRLCAAGDMEEERRRSIIELVAELEGEMFAVVESRL